MFFVSNIFVRTLVLKNIFKTCNKELMVIDIHQKGIKKKYMKMKENE